MTLRGTLALVGTLLLAAPVARAQSAAGFALNRFSPAEAGSDWFTADTLDLRGKVRPAASLVLDYAYRPLVIYDADGKLRTSVVNNQLFAHLGGSVVLVDRVRIGLSLPVAAWQNGHAGTLGGVGYPAPTSGHVGDLRIGADARLYGSTGELVTVAAGLQAWLPTGSREHYTGDGNFRLLPRVLASGEWGMLAYSGQLGFQYRALAERFGGTALGSEVLLAAAVGARLLDKKLLVGPEFYGSTVVTDAKAAFSRRATPLELLLGAHYQLPHDLKVGAGGGLGISRGFGSPQARFVVSLAWAPGPEAFLAKAAPDRDGDGIPDADDACPERKGVASTDQKRHGCPPDSDGDGILDDEDACPQAPGKRSADPKKHGCPPDRDGDGVPDAKDACPDVPGAESAEPKRNGCPPDADRDGIPDAQDACPEVAGKKSADPKKHGCPPDRDGDGIPDARDACPEVPGAESAEPKKHGCPPDRDGDGVPDAVDACLELAGAASKDPRFHGCPADKDRDGIANATDACPDEPGPKSRDPARHGCPAAAVRGAMIQTINDQVKFKTGSAELLPGKESLDALQGVLKVLVDHPGIKRVRVEGHTDNQGGAEYNKGLSAKRAQTVVKWLIGRGVAQERLASQGWGFEKPIATNDTPEGRKLNRRVEFHIEEQAGEDKP